MWSLHAVLMQEWVSPGTPAPPTETGWMSLRRSVQGEPVTLNGTEEKKAVMAKPAAAQKHKSCHQSSGLNICCLWASRSTQSFQ